MKIEVEKETLIRLASIALAYDVIMPNKDELDELYSSYLRKEIANLPLSTGDFKDLVTKTLKMVENNKT